MGTQAGSDSFAARPLIVLNVGLSSLFWGNDVREEVFSIFFKQSLRGNVDKP